MATTKAYKIGKTRIKLAKLLEEAIPGFKINPEDLHSQTPVYAQPTWDCCSWFGTGRIGLSPVDVNSWSTMSACIKNGIEVGEQCRLMGYEISPKVIKKDAELSQNVTLDIRPEIPSGMDNQVQKESIDGQGS